MRKYGNVSCYLLYHTSHLVTKREGEGDRGGSDRDRYKEREWLNFIILICKLNDSSSIFCYYIAILPRRNCSVEVY